MFDPHLSTLFHRAKIPPSGNRRYPILAFKFAQIESGEILRQAIYLHVVYTLERASPAIR
jgi:hypothetical protein